MSPFSKFPIPPISFHPSRPFLWKISISIPHFIPPNSLKFSISIPPSFNFNSPHFIPPNFVKTISLHNPSLKFIYKGMKPCWCSSLIVFVCLILLFTLPLLSLFVHCCALSSVCSVFVCAMSLFELSLFIVVLCHFICLLSLFVILFWYMILVKTTQQNFELKEPLDKITLAVEKSSSI